MVPYTQLGTPKPVATALETYPSLLWLKTLVEVGALAGLSSVILVMMVGQPRIFYTMARDGLIPKLFGRVHPEFRTPHVGTVVVTVTALILAGLLPIGVLRGASIVFFAYIGFDAVSTAAQEAKNPQRD
ncbi:MAG: Amino acid permease-associated region, partial [Steroidobacteraceae bacterium]|nr:Amino acid permease-associated region [Steroidobacteraceae bacterium]